MKISEGREGRRRREKERCEKRGRETRTYKGRQRGGGFEEEKAHGLAPRRYKREKVSN